MLLCLMYLKQLLGEYFVILAEIQKKKMFMIVGEGWKVAGRVNRMLCLLVEFHLHHDSLAQRLQYC